MPDSVTPSGQTDDLLDLVAAGRAPGQFSLRGRRVTISALVALAVPLGAAVWADHVARQREFGSLLDCVQGAERALADADARMSAMSQYSNGP